MILSILLFIVVEGAAAIWALRRTLPLGDGLFFSVFAADAFVKLLGLGLITSWLWIHHLPSVTPLVTIGLGYFAISLVQIPFLYKAR